jgi:hypothetical protein
MKLPVISSIIALTVLMSGQAFAGLFSPDRVEASYTFDKSDCPITFGRANSIFTSREELRALENFCHQLEVEKANSAYEARVQAFAAVNTGGQSGYAVCKQSPRELAVSSKSDREFNFVTAMCKRHDPNYGTARGLESSDPTIEATPSRFIRWTVIRDRTEGMPEECRYFYCDLKHFSGSKNGGPSNGWIVTLPRNKGKPEDCKKHYCQSVDTESNSGPSVNDNDRGIAIGVGH